MNDPEPLLGIAAVEREVGVSKDVLRVWERRYGFPAPRRDRHGERVYPADQVDRLRLVKRLMDQGHRPGKLLSRSCDELEALAGSIATDTSADTPASAATGTAEAVLATLESHDATGLARLLQQQLALQGLADFVQDTIAPLATVIGDGWAHGRLRVFEEHLFTETCARVLRQAIAALPPGHRPTVLLTTAPEESHGLGLLMVESLLALHGARCIALGTAMPVIEIARAAIVYEADVVALSFSSAFPARRAAGVLQQLREALPPTIEIWAGGSGVKRMREVAGVRVLAELADAVARVRELQDERGLPAPARGVAQ